MKYIRHQLNYGLNLPFSQRINQIHRALTKSAGGLCRLANYRFLWAIIKCVEPIHDPQRCLYGSLISTKKIAVYRLHLRSAELLTILREYSGSAELCLRILWSSYITLIFMVIFLKHPPFYGYLTKFLQNQFIKSMIVILPSLFNFNFFCVVGNINKNV